jgi:transcriptional regulator with XRE-family HTH domain
MIEASLGEAIRRLRERQRMSLRALAEKASFSPSFISQVENSQASPSISSMERIALALGVSLGEFFQWAETKAPRIVRVGERHGLTSEWSKAKIEALGPSGIKNKLEAVMVTLLPGGTSAKNPTPQPREEFAVVFSGTVTLTLGEGPDEVLAPGDAVSIQAGLPRRWWNTDTVDAQILVISTHSATQP